MIVRQGEAQIATPQGSHRSSQRRNGDSSRRRRFCTVQDFVCSGSRRLGPMEQRPRPHHPGREFLAHTNRRYTGTQDLDAYGRWQNVPDYGDVWVPNEPDGWVPYRNGNWTYEPYYGWTWVGYEPWGWAPYHYGRWFSYGGSWAWWPGPVYAGYNPFWSPAYVSFWGWGSGFGFGFGFGGWGGFGWLPLGPCDWFHPWWGGYRGRFGFAGRVSGTSDATVVLRRCMAERDSRISTTCTMTTCSVRCRRSMRAASERAGSMASRRRVSKSVERE